MDLIKILEEIRPMSPSMVTEAFWKTMKACPDQLSLKLLENGFSISYARGLVILDEFLGAFFCHVGNFEDHILASVIFAPQAKAKEIFNTVVDFLLA